MYDDRPWLTPVLTIAAGLAAVAACLLTRSLMGSMYDGSDDLNNHFGLLLGTVVMPLLPVVMFALVFWLRGDLADAFGRAILEAFGCAVVLAFLLLFVAVIGQIGGGWPVGSLLVAILLSAGLSLFFGLLTIARRPY